MIVITGLVILVAAVIAGVAGVLANSGHAHAVTHFAVLGYHVTGTAGTVFLYGIVAGALAVLGLSLLLADQVVAVMADGGGLAAGLRQPRPRRAAAPRGPAGAGQQQAQPEQCERADHDAVQEQRPGRPGHVVAKHREPVRQRVRRPLLLSTPTTPAIRMTNPIMTIMTRSRGIHAVDLQSTWQADLCQHRRPTGSDFGRLPASTARKAQLR